MEAQLSIQPTDNFQNFQEGEHGVQSSEKLFPEETKTTASILKSLVSLRCIERFIYNNITMAVVLEMKSDPDGKIAHFIRVPFVILVNFVKWTCK